jgi:hypothetical protein
MCGVCGGASDGCGERVKEEKSSPVSVVGSGKETITLAVFILSPKCSSDSNSNSASRVPSFLPMIPMYFYKSVTSVDSGSGGGGWYIRSSGTLWRRQEAREHD